MSNKIILALALTASIEEVMQGISTIKRAFGIDAEDEDDAIDPANTGASTATPGSVEVDFDGLPHDPRIHAGTKGKNADGRWKKRKKVEDALVASVTAELRAKGFADPNAAAAPTNAAPAPAPSSLPVPGASNAPAPGALPAPALDPYQAFVTWLTPWLAPNGRLDAEWVKSVVAYCGIDSGNIADLAGKPDKIEAVKKYISDALIAAGEKL